MYSLKILIAGLFLNGLVAQGQGYRSVGHEKFIIVDTAGFYLYRINKLVQGEKIARPRMFIISAQGRKHPCWN